jgi:mycothiol synthase
MLALPPGFTVRPMRVDDATAIVAMLNEEAEILTGESQFAVEDYTVDLQEPGANLAENTRIIHAPDGSVAGIAELTAHAPFVRLRGWVRVAHGQRRRGLGSALSRWIEGRARTYVEQAPESARVTLDASAIAGNHAATRLLEEAGYTHVRDFHVMRMELPQPPPPPRWPQGIMVRTWQVGRDDRAVYTAVDEAFGDHWGHVTRPPEEGFRLWLHGKLNDPTFDATIQFLACDGDAIAGVSLCLPALDEPFNFGWIDQLGVRRPWRNRGLAQALLLHTFGEFYRRGTRRVGLGVDADSLTGATRLYEKAGMQVHHTSAVYEKELRPGVELATRTLER